MPIFIGVTNVDWTAATVLLVGTASADTVRIALIDPLTGPMAAAGQSALDHLKFHAEKINANGGINGDELEIVGQDFHPLAKVKDFTPYVSKIQSSGAAGVDRIYQVNEYYGDFDKPEMAEQQVAMYEDTDFNFHKIAEISRDDVTLPTTCKMRRPKQG